MRPQFVKLKNVSTDTQTKLDFLDNNEVPFRTQYEQALIDIPYASRDCEKVRNFFQREYNVLNEDIFEITDTNASETKKLIEEFEARLK